MSETVLITGASSGIGLELAKLFAQSHRNLILVARSEQKLDALRLELVDKYSIHVEVIVVDLAEVHAAQTLFDEVNKRKLVVDVLVNNAGFGELGRFEKISEERQTDMVRLNVQTVVHLTRLLLPEMIKRKKGGVLNVASTAAFQPGPHMAVYYATKAFVLSFSEAIHEVTFGIWREGRLPLSWPNKNWVWRGFRDECDESFHIERDGRFYCCPSWIQSVRIE